MTCSKCATTLGNAARISTPEPRKGHKGPDAKNKLVSMKKNSSKISGVSDTKTVAFCKVCKNGLHVKAKYCAQCGYKKGRCWVCGKKILDTSMHRMSDTWR